MDRIKTIKNIYTALTVFLIAVGAILMIWPQAGLGTVLKIYGVFLIVYGAAKIYGYFAKDLFQLAFQFDFGLGIVSIILGVVMVFKTGRIIELFSVCVGIFMLIDAALKIQTAVEAKKFGVEKWWVILITCLVLALVGVLLIAAPFKAALTITRLIGLNLCIDGILNFIVVRSTVKNIRRRQDIIDEFDPNGGF